MKLHRNAKTTPASRLAMVRRVTHDGWTVADTALGFGVSTRTVAKWRRRFQVRGVAGLEDGSSRPGAPPHQTPARVVARIRALRTRHGLPAWAIAARVGVPRSTVGAWLRRLGVSRPVAEPPVPIQRYEWPAPGDLLHLDIKPLGRIGQVGHRIHGDRRRRSRGVGWEYVHVAIDDHSRITYAEILADQRGTTCAAFLERAVAWYAARGITIRRAMTDNGSGYVALVFRSACRRLGLRHLRTRPYTPRTNGKAERVIQTLLREWAYVRAYRSSWLRQRELARYLSFYNHRRPHASLSYRAPWTRLQSAA